MYTTCEAGKRRSVNHMRALASPGRAEGEGVARPDGRCACACAAGRDVQVPVRCGAVRCAEMRRMFCSKEY